MSAEADYKDSQVHAGGSIWHTPSPPVHYAPISINGTNIIGQKKEIKIVRVSNGYIIGEEGDDKLVFNDFYDMCNHLRSEFGEPDPNVEDK